MMIDRMNNTNEKHSEHKIIGNDISNSHSFLIPHCSSSQRIGTGIKISVQFEHICNILGS